MKRRGFTLIELLGVIIVLGVILLIAVPSVKKILKDSKEELYKTQITNIKEGLKNWAVDNNKLLPTIENETINLTLGQLKLGGYVDTNLRNPKNNKCFGNDMVLAITRYQKNYVYEVNDKTGTETDECSDYMLPYIILKGEPITYVEVLEPYIEQGVIATSVDGSDITDSVITTISGSGTEVDTSKVGNKYTITYTVNSDEIVSINRTVKVVDTTKPVLTIPEDVTINREEISFDAMDGVSVSDNSGENIEVKVKSNISFGIPGDYTVIYEAKDSSGNTTTKTRIVTVTHKTLVLKDIAVADPSLGVDSVDPCAISGICPNGTPFVVEVNKTEQYKFYIINDTGSEVTLIMNKNLGPSVPWINLKDYLLAGGSEEVYSDFGDNTKGPITAFEAVEIRTHKWSNIQSFTYTLVDDGGGNKYSPLIRDGVKARLLTRTEANKLGCRLTDATCPTWLSENLSSENNTEEQFAYWLSTASSGGHANSFGVRFSGNVYYDNVSGRGREGVRPVIKVPK